MPTRKRKSKKKFDAETRKRDASKWLLSKDGPYREYVKRYTKRYGVDPDIAKSELYEIGYYEDVYREELESQGIPWEYIMNPLSGELVLVPEGTQEHELFM